MHEENGRFLAEQRQAISFDEQDVCINGIVVISRSTGCFILRETDDLRQLFGWREPHIYFEEHFEENHSAFE